MHGICRIAWNGIARIPKQGAALSIDCYGSIEWIEKTSHFNKSLFVDQEEHWLMMMKSSAFRLQTERLCCFDVFSLFALHYEICAIAPRVPRLLTISIWCSSSEALSWRVFSLQTNILSKYLSRMIYVNNRKELNVSKDSEISELSRAILPWWTVSISVLGKIPSAIHSVALAEKLLHS